MKSHDFGPLPPVNKRAFILRDAEVEIGAMIAELSKKYELTASEQFLILSKEMAILANACVSREHRERVKLARHTP